LFNSARAKEAMPATVLFVDFDLYRENLPWRKEDFKKRLPGFLKLGKSEIQERSAAFVEQFGGFEK
jgi:hypothetical protein